MSLAREHLQFAMQLCQLQIAGRDYFIHEHPWAATSWALEEVQTLMACPGVQRVRAEICQFGLVV